MIYSIVPNAFFKSKKTAPTQVVLSSKNCTVSMKTQFAVSVSWYW